MLVFMLVKPGLCWSKLQRLLREGEMPPGLSDEEALKWQMQVDFPWVFATLTPKGLIIHGGRKRDYEAHQYPLNFGRRFSRDPYFLG